MRIFIKSSDGKNIIESKNYNKDEIENIIKDITDLLSNRPQLSSSSMLTCNNTNMFLTKSFLEGKLIEVEVETSEKRTTIKKTTKTSTTSK